MVKRLATLLLMGVLCLGTAMPAQAVTLGKQPTPIGEGDFGLMDTYHTDEEVKLITKDKDGNELKTSGNIRIYFPMYEVIASSATALHSVNAELAKTEPVYFMPKMEDFPTSLVDLARDPDRDENNMITYVYDGYFDQEVTYLTPEVDDNGTDTGSDDVYHLQTSKQVYGNFGSARVLELLGYDILLESESCDMSVTNGDVPSLDAKYETKTAYSKNNTTKKLTTNTAVMDLYKALKQPQWDIQLAYTEDGRLNSDNSPIWNLVHMPLDNRRLDVTHGKCWVFATRTNPDLYWKAVQADQIFGQSHLIPTNGTGYTGETSSVTFTKGQNSHITMGEFLAVARAMMELYGEPVVTGEMQDDIIKSYGFALPEGQSEEITSAVKYMAAKGIINPTEIDYNKEITFTDIQDILVRIYDPDSRLEYPKVPTTTGELADDGFIQADDNGVSELEDAGEITNVDTNIYYDYFVEENGYTAFLKKKSDKYGTAGDIMTEGLALGRAQITDEESGTELRPIRAGELIGDVAPALVDSVDSAVAKKLKLTSQPLWEYKGEVTISDKPYYHLKIYKGLKPVGNKYQLTYYPEGTKTDVSDGKATKSAGYAVDIDYHKFTGDGETSTGDGTPIELEDMDVSSGLKISDAESFCLKLQKSKDSTKLKEYQKDAPVIDIPYGGGVYTSSVRANDDESDVTKPILIHYCLDGYLYSKADINDDGVIEVPKTEYIKQGSYSFTNNLNNAMSPKYLDNVRHVAAYKAAKPKDGTYTFGKYFTNASAVDEKYEDLSDEDDSSTDTDDVGVSFPEACVDMVTSIARLFRTDVHTVETDYSLLQDRTLCDNDDAGGSVMFQVKQQVLRDKADKFKFNGVSMKPMIDAVFNGNSEVTKGATASLDMNGRNVTLVIQAVYGTGDKALVTCVLSGDIDITTFKKDLHAPTAGRTKRIGQFYFDPESSEAYVSISSLTDSELISGKPTIENGLLHIRTTHGADVYIKNGGSTNGYVIIGECMYVQDTNFTGYVENAGQTYVNVRACTNWASKLCYLATKDGEVTLIVPRSQIVTQGRYDQYLPDGKTAPIWIKSGNAGYMSMESSNPTANYLCVVSKDGNSDGVFSFYPKSKDTDGSESSGADVWNSYNVGSMPSLETKNYFAKFTPLKRETKAANHWTYYSKKVQDVAGNSYDKAGAYFYIIPNMSKNIDKLAQYLKDGTTLPYLKIKKNVFCMNFNTCTINGTRQGLGVLPSLAVLPNGGESGKLAKAKLTNKGLVWELQTSGGSYKNEDDMIVVPAPINVWYMYKGVAPKSRSATAGASVVSLYGTQVVTRGTGGIKLGKLSLSAKKCKFIPVYALDNTKTFYAFPATEQSLSSSNKQSQLDQQIGEAADLVDWDKYSFGSILRNFDGMTSVVMVFTLTLFPRIGFFGILLYLLAAILSDNSLVRKIFHMTIDPVKILSFGQSDCEKVDYKTVVVYMTIALAVFGFIMDGHILVFIEWLMKFYGALAAH